MRRAALFAWLRITLLTLLLALLCLYLLLALPHRVDWHSPVRVRIYPINADHQPATARHLASLDASSFADMERFFSREAKRYRLGLDKPILVELEPEVQSLPPAVPETPSILQSLWWALKMKLWVWQYDGWSAGGDIRIFMSFYAPGNPLGLQHSLGMQKGGIGLVNGFASAERQSVNNFVAAHELLHTLGASDKYDMQTGQPLWPDGFGDPVQTPLFPQQRAEIMGGRVQVSPGWALLPPSLDFAVVGSATAIEIGWLAVHE